MHFLSFFNFALSPWTLYMTGCVFSNPVYTGMDMMDDRTLSIYIIYRCLSFDTTTFLWSRLSFLRQRHNHNLWCCRFLTQTVFYDSVAFSLFKIVSVFLSSQYFFDVFNRLSTVFIDTPKYSATSSFEGAHRSSHFRLLRQTLSAFAFYLPLHSFCEFL